MALNTKVPLLLSDLIYVSDSLRNELQHQPKIKAIESAIFKLGHWQDEDLEAQTVVVRQTPDRWTAARAVRARKHKLQICAQEA